MYYFHVLMKTQPAWHKKFNRTAIAQAVSHCLHNYRHLSDIKSNYTAASVDWFSLAFVFAIKFTKLRMHTWYIPDSKTKKKLTHAVQPRHRRRLVMRPSQSSLHIHVPRRAGVPCILMPPGTGPPVGPRVFIQHIQTGPPYQMERVWKNCIQLSRTEFQCRIDYYTVAFSSLWWWKLSLNVFIHEKVPAPV
jgi:hypothetical protein